MVEKSKRKTLLIVDDQAINRKILMNMVKSQYDYQEASNGKEALKMLRKGDTKFSLILLDLVMPVMDGYDFLREIRSFPEFAHIPIIVLTSNNIIMHEKRALQMGATDFITKPYNPEIIKIKIDTLLELQESIGQSSMVKKDSLTQLYTQEEFFFEGSNIVRSLDSSGWSVVCIDFANLATINSIGGYPEGDKLLQAAAKKILYLAEKNHGIAGRTWSDTMAVLLPDVTSTADIRNEIDAMRDFFDSYPLNISIDVKVGFANATSADNTLRRIYDNARLAIGDIKNTYFSTINVYDEELDERLRMKIELAEEISTALAEHQIEIYLQPKVDMRYNRISGAEALVRWNHPKRGLLSSGVFVPIFEDNGFITKIDKYVFKETCRILHEMKEKSIKPMPISVHISRIDLFDKNLTSTFMNYMKIYDVDPSLIHIEITETVYMSDAAFVRERIASFIDCGFKIEMDDFGSEYSSLTLLTEMPLDIIKLDVQFIFNRHSDPKHDAIFKFINMLSIELDKPVIVEGVSTKEDVDFLLRYNFKYAQGFYYSKPLPVDDFLEYYLNNHETPAGNADEIESAQLKSWLTELRYSDFIEQMPVGFIIFDIANNIKYISEHIKVLLKGESDYDFDVNDLTDLRSFLSNESVTQLLAKESSLLKSDNSHDMFYLEFKRKTLPNLVIPAYLYTFSSFGNVSWTLMLITDLAVVKGDSETNSLVHKINRLEQEIQLDRLTQLYDRFYFEQLVDFELKTRSHENAFIFIDLDNFKQKNDTKGHQYGDHVLRSFSKMLKRSFRGDDYICRMGGDEFCIFARNVDSSIALEAHTKRLYEKASRELDLTFSYGIVLSPHDGNTFDELYNASDLAMYASKKDKQNDRD